MGPFGRRGVPSGGFCAFEGRICREAAGVTARMRATDGKSSTPPLPVTSVGR